MNGTSEQRQLERLTDAPLPSDAHRARRAEELAWVRAHGWAPALLAVRADVEAARAAGVVVGPAMGSTEASFLLWCLGLTDFDPVTHGLMPSTFYRPVGGAPAGHARWYASRDPERSTRFQNDHLVAMVAARDDGSATSEAAGCEKLARRGCQADSDYGDRRDVKAGRWSFERYPDARWILAHGSTRGFEDLVCAYSLARPGPAGCGMLEAYLEARDVADPPLPRTLGVSRGVLVFREQLHAVGQEVLGLDIDQTRGFARDISAGNAEQWERRLRIALAKRRVSAVQTDRLWTAMTGWFSFLFPLAHALGQARLLLRAAHLNVGFRAQ